MTFVIALSGIAVSVGEYRNQPLANSLFVLAGLILLVWLILEFWQGKWRWRRRKRLVLNPAIRELPLPVSGSSRQKIKAGLADRGHGHRCYFAVVSVKNDGKKDIASLIPKIHFADASTAPAQPGKRSESQEAPSSKTYGAWYEESDRSFEHLSSNGIRLNVGAERDLVLALTFHPRITRGPGSNWYPVESGETDMYYDPLKVMSAKRELGRAVVVRIQFRSVGVDQSTSFSLGSDDDDKPVIR